MTVWNGSVKLIELGDNMTKQTIKSIKEWLHDYELATDEFIGDDDTLDGSAYNLFNKILREEKEYQDTIKI